ncbi:MAG TPA: hypothetical protein VHB21_16965 [Minicystis sp.]|nr:hypothetical protein [Minicystis sp.]
MGRKQTPPPGMDDTDVPGQPWQRTGMTGPGLPVHPPPAADEDTPAPEPRGPRGHLHDMVSLPEGEEDAERVDAVEREHETEADKARGRGPDPRTGP